MKRVRLEKGKKAPFTGQLLSDAAVAKLLSDYQQPGLDPAIAEGLSDYVARKKASMPDSFT